jgi:SPP1 family phage portal protein
MIFINETEKINKKIIEDSKSVISLEEMIVEEINSFKNSKEYKLMLKSEKYYRNESDIKNKQTNNTSVSNQKLEHAFYKKLVDQKVGYLASKPLNIRTENIKYQEILQELFNNNMRLKLQNVTKETVKKGIAWWQVYFEDGIQFKKIPSEQIIPLWKDMDNTILYGIIRVYNVHVYKSTIKTTETKVEYYDTNGIRYYVLEAGKLIPDVTKDVESTHVSIDTVGYNWEKVPFVYFKYNEEEIPLLQYVKELIDDYNMQKSTNSDILNDLPNLIYVLKNYGGEDLKTFLHNLKETRAIDVNDDGNVTTLRAEPNTQAVESHTTSLRKDIYEFGRGVDTTSEKVGNSSGVALKFLYADLDLDCNMLEANLQQSMEQTLWFIDQYLLIVGQGDFTQIPVEFIFNRDILISETEVIENCKNSEGVISKKTIMANHPFVRDLEQELEQIEEEKEQDIEEAGPPYEIGGDGSGS